VRAVLGWTAVATALLGWTGVAAATPVVIHDAGGTEPIAPYMAPYLEAVAPSSRVDPTYPSPPLRPPAEALDPRHGLPVTSPGLEPGRLTRDASPEVRERLRFLSRPLCLVGADDWSLQWLDAHSAALRAAGAVCLAVEVPDERAWEQLVAVAQGVPIVLASGADLAETLRLRVYPVLITRDGLEQ
jgi:integrating conjugative element protein (TIGR03765 family)